METGGIPDLNAGALAPVTDEVELTDLPVQGCLPEVLNGMLVRNGPNPYTGAFSGEGMLSWWPEAAMVHGIHLKPGAAPGYRNRWLRTRGWARHFEADRWEVFPETNPNVNIIRHAGRDLALAEGGPPLQIDASLATGTVPGSLAAGVTAHPKLDPVTGELVWFRSSWTEPYLVYGVADAEGTVTVEQEVALQGPAMMHDFAISERYSLLLDLNVAYDLSLFERGLRVPIRWHDERTARIGVLPRSGGEVRWISIEPCFIQHVANAYETGDGKIVLDAIRYSSFLKLDAPGRNFEVNPLGRLWRYEIDLGAGTASERQLCTKDVEMPRINESFTGRPYHYVYGVLQPSDQEMRGVVKVDVCSGRTDEHVPPPGDQNSEPVFVPDPDRAGAEDGGWLLSCAYRAETDTSDLLILDAQDLGQVVASISLPRRIPAGFHGAWLPDV